MSGNCYTRMIYFSYIVHLTGVEIEADRLYYLLINNCAHRWYSLGELPTRLRRSCISSGTLRFRIPHCSVQPWRLNSSNIVKLKFESWLFKRNSRQNCVRLYHLLPHHSSSDTSRPYLLVSLKDQDYLRRCSVSQLKFLMRTLASRKSKKLVTDLNQWLGWDSRWPSGQCKRWGKILFL